MSSTPEPILDLGEIVGLYKEDARHMVELMRAALQRWEEVASGGSARYDLRKLSHQLRGSGQTYGFRDVTRVAKAVEKIILKLEGRALLADDRVRHAVATKVERLAAIFAQGAG